MKKISAGEFKAKCLKLMDHVKNFHEVIIVTKHGKPVAKLVAIEEEKPKSVFGFLKDTVTIHGDITRAIDEDWHALKE